MTRDDIDLMELPDSLFHTVYNEMVRWEAYSPTTIEADIPFKKCWWKYVYWIPKIKKKIYVMNIYKGKFAVDLYLYKELGCDQYFMERYYKEFLGRLRWMRKNYKVTVLEETK